MRTIDEAGEELPPGEAGELIIRGRNVMKGYWRRPDATAEAITRGGWLKTGDIAKVDEDGYFFIVDRKKELVIRGGFNVYPREIEEVFFHHPDVREAAVIGFPHAELGEEVAAAVALKTGAHTTPAELRDFTKQRVAAYESRAKSGSSTNCPRLRPARSSNARSSRPPSAPRPGATAQPLYAPDRAAPPAHAGIADRRCVGDFDH